MASHLLRIDGNALRFTCTIGRRHTDITTGHEHGAGKARGSALEAPLVENGPLSLWLEHVVDEKTKERGYWLMWYRAGKPAVSMTPMLNAADLRSVGTTLTRVGKAASDDELVEQS